MDDAKTFKTDAIHEDDKLIQDRTVVAVFTDEATANQARDALVTVGYKKVDVTTADPADEGKPVHEHGFWDGLKRMFGGHRDAPVYGDAVVRGHSLVTVHTEQGRAARAVDILDGFAPIDVTGAEQAWVDTSPAPADSRRTEEADIVPTPDTLVASEQVGLVEEEILIVEQDEDQSNLRVRSYSRNLPVVIDDQDRALVTTGADGAEVVSTEAVKRAD